MIIPQFWAEARAVHREKKKRVTLRRFGWSDVSQEEAQKHAQSRADEALTQWRDGGAPHARDLKVAYSGDQGLPIREEILERSGDSIVTRNSYGAHCLNTPNVLFADIDFNAQQPTKALDWIAFIVGLVALAIALKILQSPAACAVGFSASMATILIARGTYALKRILDGGGERVAMKNVRTFHQAHPDWGLRIYKTPAGLRVLVTHQTFAPSSDEVRRFFEALCADPLYAQLCIKQDCFRARLTAKPWRIGIRKKMPPLSVWPIPAQCMADRQAWVRAYEPRASEFAACRFVEQLGSSFSTRETRAVCALHDERSRAESALPLA